MLLLNPTNQSNSKDRIIQELENEIQFYLEIKTQSLKSKNWYLNNENQYEYRFYFQITMTTIIFTFLFVLLFFTLYIFQIIMIALIVCLFINFFTGLFLSCDLIIPF